MIHKNVSNILCCIHFLTQIIFKKICIAKLAMQIQLFGFALPNWQCKSEKKYLHCQIGNANQKK